MNGFSITLAAKGPERDHLIAELWDAGTTGITEDDDWLRAFFDAGADSDAIMQRFRSYRPRLEPEEEHDWVQHAQAMWRPFEVGERFWLVPEWQEDPTPPGRLRLSLRPGLACGSGAHPATQLCLQALERTVNASVTVLDVGTGSGILAEAARMLGARAVIACDIDHSATLVARQNIPEVALFTGSLRSVRALSVDVVVANLNAATLSNAGADLRRVARSDIIVSGFREEEGPRVEKAVGRNIKQSLELDGWLCLIF